MSETVSADEAALLAAVRADPDDDTPRLVYADWLDDHDRPERAEFIREQIELARLESLPENQSGDYVVWREAYEPYRKREREYIDRAGYSLCDGLFGDQWKVDGQSKGRNTVAVRMYRGAESVNLEVTLSRGFVGGVKLPLAAFLGRVCGRCRGEHVTYLPSAVTTHCDKPTQERWDSGNVRGGIPPRWCSQCWATFLPEVKDYCQSCSGAGRIGRCAEELFARHPVLDVVLTDREPARLEKNWWAWSSERQPTREPDASTLPNHLFDVLPDKHPNRDYWSDGYRTRELALDALSAACVNYGRSLVA